mmetsp:Transcript_139397/g.242426  ORF Transcript_139397/g.242426 Transcript_139397/m.242426 type:complete len:111 (-) Transcript_139397:147-479(-)
MMRWCTPTNHFSIRFQFHILDKMILKPRALVAHKLISAICGANQGYVQMWGHTLSCYPPSMLSGSLVQVVFHAAAQNEIIQLGPEEEGTFARTLGSETPFPAIICLAAYM